MKIACRFVEALSQNKLNSNKCAKSGTLLRETCTDRKIEGKSFDSSDFPSCIGCRIWNSRMWTTDFMVRVSAANFIKVMVQGV